MKKISFYAILIALSLIAFISCEKEPTSTPDNPIEGKHFDIWTQIGGNIGMGTGQFLVKSTLDLENGEIDFQTGVDVSKKINVSFIVKDKYYYHVSETGRFGKYQITGNSIETIKEIPFPTLKDRRHAHTWLDNKTLLLVGSTGDSGKILWVKIDTEAMEILSEGELNLPTPPAGQVYNTAGIVAYRKSDNKIIYLFKYNKQGNKGTEPAKEFYAAFINPADMAVVKVVTENRAEMMASTAYGELRQNKTFFDEKGDYYIACNSVLPGESTNTTAQHGALFRIKNSETDFDKTYNGYSEPRGKMINMLYLNNGKALIYLQDPLHTTGNTVWNSTDNPYVFYCVVLDLKSKTFKELKDIPHSKNSYSQLSLLVGKKAYIGVNPEVGNSKVFIYDTTTEKVTEGVSLKEGFSIDRMVLIED